MIPNIARRVIFSLGAVWFAATATFLLVHAAPGDPAIALGGEYGAPGYLDDVRRSYGLDRPLVIQYADWIARLCRGDLGYSYRSRASVLSLIGESAKVTSAIMIPAIMVASVVGTLLGFALALGNARARFAVGALAGLHAVPSYVIAHILILALALKLKWFPVQGLTDPRISAIDGFPLLADTLWRLALPIMTIALGQTAFIALVVRARIMEELARPYMLTALSKGLGRWRALVAHAWPNAAVGVLTLTGWRLGAMLGGAVVVETVFALPGLGRLAATSALARDHPTVTGIVLVACTFMVLVSLSVDILARRIDPRIGEERP